MVADQTTRLGTATLNSALPPIMHCLLFCSHALLVAVLLTTSSICQLSRQRTRRKFELGWTESSTYLPTLTNKEIGTIFSALQPSPPWFPYSTSIVGPVSRRLRVLSLAELHPQQQSRHFHRQRHSPYWRRSPRRTISLYYSSMHMRNDYGRIRHAPFVLRLSARRMPRNCVINDFVRCGLSAACIPSMLEPSDLDRGVGKRPDAITVYPYSCGRCLIYGLFVRQHHCILDPNTSRARSWVGRRRCNVSFVTTSITMANSGDRTDPWCTPTFTSNSSDKCFQTFTFVYTPLYRLITALTNASGIPFFLIAHFITFHGPIAHRCMMKRPDRSTLG